ncbi:NUDIX domain-containing protein [Streptomyces bauhiniae]|uniref:NUDIX domain-containing protein n=1 Tax=Streptomyces bauhiniae TaxID=2340725 RepID=UPI0035E24330
MTYADKGRPSPHALTGAGVAVPDAAGRVLLGWSKKRGVWELPGGKNDAGEGFAEAAVRELAEETGLRAEAEDARLLALLMDSVYGCSRRARMSSRRGSEPADLGLGLSEQRPWRLPPRPQPLRVTCPIRGPAPAASPPRPRTGMRERADGQRGTGHCSVVGAGPGV